MCTSTLVKINANNVKLYFLSNTCKQLFEIIIVHEKCVDINIVSDLTKDMKLEEKIKKLFAIIRYIFKQK